MIMRCPWCWNCLTGGWTICIWCWTTFVIMGFLEPALTERLNQHGRLMKQLTMDKAKALAAAHLGNIARKNGRVLIGNEMINKLAHHHLVSLLLHAV